MLRVCACHCVRGCHFVCASSVCTSMSMCQLACVCVCSLRVCHTCATLSSSPVCVCVCVSPTPSIAFRHLPPKEGCRKPVLGVCPGSCSPPPPAPTSPLCDESGRGGWCLVSWTWLWCDGLSCLIRECHLPGLLWHFTCCVCVFVD